MFLYDFSDVFFKKKCSTVFFFYALRVDNARPRYLVRTSCEKPAATYRVSRVTYFLVLALFRRNRPFYFFRKPDGYYRFPSAIVVSFGFRKNADRLFVFYVVIRRRKQTTRLKDDLLIVTFFVDDFFKFSTRRAFEVTYIFRFIYAIRSAGGLRVIAEKRTVGCAGSDENKQENKKRHHTVRNGTSC